MSEHVMLIGMMGSGKSTTGSSLSRLMRRPFHDSDAEILLRTGLTVPEIFERHGEAAFRAEERVVLASALTSRPPSVIAVAGGAVFNPDSRRRIRQAGVVVWLRARPVTLVRRVGSGHGRPLLEHDPAGTLAQLDSFRRPVYSSIADVVVDVDHKSRLAVVEAVLRGARSWLEERSLMLGEEARRLRVVEKAWP
ncbi:MAG: shikimate kinase [Acidimicrobiales bacterium]